MSTVKWLQTLWKNVVPSASESRIPKSLFDLEVNADDTTSRNVGKYSHNDTESLNLEGDMCYAETLPI